MTRPTVRSTRSTDSTPSPSSLLRPGPIATLALAAALLLPTTLAAQQGQQNRREIVNQLRQVTRQLQQIRQQAMQDSALQARRDAVAEMVRDRMKGVSDSTAAQVERMEELQGKMRSARQAQDTARMQQAQREMMQLNRSLQGPRQQAMQDPEVNQRIQALQSAVRERMREVDPEADSLLQRADSLRALLQGRRGGGPGQGGGGGAGGGA